MPLQRGDDKIGAGGRRSALIQSDFDIQRFPSRNRPSFTLVPGSVVAMRERSSAKLLSGLPFMLTITSPDLIPAFAEPEFAKTSLTKAPR
jgi:hypothetical protein